MELAFTKLFNKIVTSSVWSEDDKVRIMWITMLALSDRNGFVAAAIPGLAATARMSLEEAQAAVDILEAPDPYSRTKAAEGRRIMPVDGGWEIVTYDTHRKLLSRQERLEYKAEWIRKKRRQKRRQTSTVVGHEETGVTQAEADTTSTKVDVVNNGENFVSELAKDSTYQGIDVMREFGKMKNWCMVHNVQPTSRRFVNWLNRADKPLKPTKSARDRWEVFPQRPSREPTEEELAAQRKIVREASEKLKNQLQPGK